MCGRLPASTAIVHTVVIPWTVHASSTYKWPSCQDDAEQEILLPACSVKLAQAWWFFFFLDVCLQLC